MTASYCTIAELKLQDHLNITDADSDASLGDIIDAVSRWIDMYCGREFYTTTETRYFTSWYNDLCFVDDISTTTGLAIYTDASGDGVYEDTWTTSDYYLRPYNVKNGQPYYAIETRIGGNFIFPTVPHGVKITATWGFTAVPDQIKQACILQSERLFKRFATPLGSSGMTALGEVRLQIPNADGDVLALLKPYVRLGQ